MEGLSVRIMFKKFFSSRIYNLLIVVEAADYRALLYRFYCLNNM